MKCQNNISFLVQVESTEDIYQTNQLSLTTTPTYNAFALKRSKA